MYHLRVEREFCAAHALRFGSGAIEPIHGHNFRCTVTLAAEALDSNGLVVDFHALERLIDRILKPLSNQNLNTVRPFDRQSPSAEHIATFIAHQLVDSLARLKAPDSVGLRVLSVTLTEAPGCAVTYLPPSSPSPLLATGKPGKEHSLSQPARRASKRR